jgi:hypothetical protein
MRNLGILWLSKMRNPLASNRRHFLFSLFKIVTKFHSYTFVYARSYPLKSSLLQTRIEKTLANNRSVKIKTQNN